jgi:hypothetical protein
MVSEQTASHPKSSPQTLTMNFARPWSIVRPRLYRHLEAKYVESFFSDGSLRLSSFARFAQHPDEQLRDTAEGIGSRFGLGSQATIAMVGGRGRDCYVLCATLHNTEGVRKLFGNSNACIAIDNIQGFANAISLKLPYFTQGFEGPVIYQDDTTIYKTIGATTAEQLIEQYKNPDGTLRMEMLQDMHKMTGGIEEFFLKHSRHAQECEYRLLWAISQTPEPFIDIKVPGAIQFCRHVTKES